VDVFGDVDEDGSGEAWEYQDGWAYRYAGQGINGGVWDSATWFYSGVDALDRENTNAAATTPVPIGGWLSVAVDSDSDGVIDQVDVFPNDPDESLDSDQDGVGNNADAFPNDPNETIDSDGDGVGDNSDAYPDDPRGSVLATSLMITSVFDGTLSGGYPKGVEFYALDDIPDLSIYGFAVALNGEPSASAAEFVFPADAVSAGTRFTVGYESSGYTGFEEWFGVSATYTTPLLSINGDDAIELFKLSNAVDVYGVPGVDGSNSDWNYQDGWAYRLNGRFPTTEFVRSDWSVRSSGLQSASDADDADQYIDRYVENMTDVPALGPYGLLGMMAMLGLAGVGLVGREEDDDTAL
jgi:hypothetical protein